MLKLQIYKLYKMNSENFQNNNVSTTYLFTTRKIRLITRVQFYKNMFC